MLGKAAPEYAHIDKFVSRECGKIAPNQALLYLPRVFILDFRIAMAAWQASFHNF